MEALDPKALCFYDAGWLRVLTVVRHSAAQDAKEGSASHPEPSLTSYSVEIMLRSRIMVQEQDQVRSKWELSWCLKASFLDAAGWWP